MKKILLVFAAIAITLGAYAQSDLLNKKNNPQDLNKSQSQNLQSKPVDKMQPDGVMMKNGKIMMVKKGEMTLLDNDITLANGTKIMIDGAYIKSDGTRMMLKEGQHIDMDGNVSIIKKAEDKNMFLVPDSTRKLNF